MSSVFFSQKSMKMKKFYVAFVAVTNAVVFYYSHILVAIMVKTRAFVKSLKILGAVAVVF